MITVDDVMEVAGRNLRRDVLLLGGVGEETMDDSVLNPLPNDLPGYW